MFNTRQVLNAETQHAKFYKYDYDTRQFAVPVKFMYKTYDDTQYRQTRTQAQAGNVMPKFSLSIKTSAPLDFSVSDKIVLEYDGREYTITAVQELQNHNVLTSLIMPAAKGQHTKLIHLNKDDI
jgi:hypothetical protein